MYTVATFFSLPMDWKYKYFAQEAVFQQAQREAVLAAMRSFVAEALADWKTIESQDGLEAKGHTGGHDATANFRAEAVPDGTKVTIKLRVERASALGYMLVDVGSYYDRSLRHWLDGIQVFLRTGSNGQPRESIELRKQAVADSRRAEGYFTGLVRISLFLTIGVSAGAWALRWVLKRRSRGPEPEQTPGRQI